GEAVEPFGGVPGHRGARGDVLDDGAGVMRVEHPGPSGAGGGGRHPEQRSPGGPVRNLAYRPEGRGPRGGRFSWFSIGAGCGPLDRVARRPSCAGIRRAGGAVPWVAVANGDLVPVAGTEPVGSTLPSQASG